MIMADSVKTLADKITSFANGKGRQRIEVMDSLLDYIIGFLDPTHKPVEGWQYKGEDNMAFWDMMAEYFCIMQKGLVHHEWYDAWGDIFMSLTTQGGGKGQFFTPVSLCDLMAMANISDTDDFASKGIMTSFGHRVTVSDPSAGSSRNLLAAHARLLHLKQKKPYLVAEDVDAICCKMSAVNMAVHGCFGEVVCHNTLSEPDKVRMGWIINETMFPFPTGVPSIRRCDDANRLIATRLWLDRNERKEVTPPSQPKEPVQLSIF